jgi:Xaa-Pro aminopeptidase
LTDFRFPHRVEGLRALLPQGENPVEAIIVSNLENCRYLSGFTGSNALVLVTAAEAFFLTDGRYRLQSATEVPGYERIILPQGTSLAEAAGELVKRVGARTVGFEGGHLTFSGYEALKKAMPEEETVTLVPRGDAVESLRQVKDADEVAAIRRAIALADACFDFIRGTARAGMTEKELAWEMEVFLRHTKGATKLGFESIVGSGPNSALIHGRPSERVLGSSGGPEFLLCDYGCEVDGYNSDITRTFVLGGEPTPRQREIYEAVRRAQVAALEAIRPGMVGKDVDKVARDVLTEAGLGEAFGHGLGHGLGRQVHDHLAFSQKSEVVLKPGMVVTVEPGAYIEGLGGVRIEDDVLVTETGGEVLTHSTKELIVLG